MNFFDIHKPQKLDEYITNKEQVQKAIKWILDYKNNVENTKKVLFIIGSTGIGKTLLAELIFKEFNYQKIELNSSDIRSQKKLGEFLKKSLTFKNVVDMFNDGNQPIGILMDEIDTICKLNDKGGMSEFLDLLKQNDKFEINKKKNKKTKIYVDNYIKLYNPIICTSNNINDKKINELKKYSEVIYLEKPSIEELKCIIRNCFNKINKIYEEDVLEQIAEYCIGDLRQLMQILNDLLCMSDYSDETIINKDLFNSYTCTFNTKIEDVQLIDSTKLLLTNKMEISKTQILFDIDCLLTPLMIYHNSIDYIKNSEDTSIKKLTTYKNILNSLCVNDTIQTNIFEAQDWNELYDIASIYGASIPNYYSTQLKNKKEVTIEFTSLLNKISQMYVNKKLLNGAKYSLGKLNYDNDEIIYITEIISYYFDNYKNNLNEQESDRENSIESISNDDNLLFTKKNIKENKSELITFMNKYNIGIDDLENILKIEKLNKMNEKRKKKFTLKIKKDISNYLIK